MTLVRWAYGVTCVPQRFDTLLPRTLASLARAGFDSPHLFVDHSWEHEVPEVYRKAYHVTCRWPDSQGVGVRAQGNWTLGLWELYIRNHHCDLFAMFQDDLVACRGLKEYLTQVPYPEKGYLNLYTFPSNQQICPRDPATGRQREGWYHSNQCGRGAVALVFDKPTVEMILSCQHIVHRIQDVHWGHRKLDGGLIEGARKAGWREWVHNPSLVQHTGQKATAIGNVEQPLAPSFRGEDWDACSLLWGK